MEEKDEWDNREGGEVVLRSHATPLNSESLQLQGHCAHCP